jgi:hypothetical protein
LTGSGIGPEQRTVRGFPAGIDPQGVGDELEAHGEPMRLQQQRHLVCNLEKPGTIHAARVTETPENRDSGVGIAAVRVIFGESTRCSIASAPRERRAGSACNARFSKRRAL